MALHAALLLGDHYAGFTPTSLVVPFTATYRPEWTGLGIIALYLCAAVYWSVHVRDRIGYRAWRAIHLLSFVAFALALSSTASRPGRIRGRRPCVSCTSSPVRSRSAS